MLVLGLNGGFSPAHTNVTGESEGQCHDSAAVLIRDGRVIAAFEEERLDRIKHTNRFPANAIRACLSAANVRLQDVDRVAMGMSDECFRHTLRRQNFVPVQHHFSRALGLDRRTDADPVAFVQELLKCHVGSEVEENCIGFVNHHMAHALSAFAPSGFDRALVVTMDGRGDDESGYVAVGSSGGLEILRVIRIRDSLGAFYQRATVFLGFGVHDQYKVMGLAPYGRPDKYRDLFSTFYTLGPDGDHEVHADRMTSLTDVMPRRLPSEPITKQHEDVAAALQCALESIVLHVLEYYRRTTGLEKLCLAGGVAHNCTLNGKILRSGLFSHVFVQPASHDAGTALGAAIYANSAGVPNARVAGARTMPHQYWGSDIGGEGTVGARLGRWAPLVSAERCADIADAGAALLAEGRVIGWVQGRAEFGPRALGNRSLLADPRPASNKELINAMVKKRESFRPFAPAVMAEHADEWFEIPSAQADLGHMTYVLQVRAEKRAVLGAVTHVDGSARVQTVQRRDNERFWSLIDRFRQISGVPIVLNTSFNNNAEPIVDSVDDAVACFLTTEIHYLIVDSWLVTKREVTYEACRGLVPSFMPHLAPRQVRQCEPGRGFVWSRQMANNFNDRISEVSAELWRVLEAVDGERGLGEIVESLGLEPGQVFPQVLDAWSRRLLKLSPREQSPGTH